METDPNLCLGAVSGPEVPGSLKRIEVEAEVVGRLMTRTLEAAPNQVAELFWDGLDFRGRPVGHAVTARIRIGYVYDGAYNMLSGYLRMSLPSSVAPSPRFSPGTR